LSVSEKLEKKYEPLLRKFDENFDLEIPYEDLNHALTEKSATEINQFRNSLDKFAPKPIL
jgi:hypothetical protein